MDEENKNSNLIVPETTAHHQAARINLLYGIVRILASLETLKEGAPQMLEAICRQLDFELGELWYLDEAENALALESVWHLPSPPLDNFVASTINFRFNKGDGTLGKVWETNAPVWVEDIRTDNHLARKILIEEVGFESAFAFPISLGEKLIGVFSFFSKQARPVDSELVQMFAVLGGNIGQFIERERIEGDLRKSEDRYRAFIEQSTEGIWRFELDEKFPVTLSVEQQIELTFERGYLAECNDAMARMYGLERAEELVGARITDLLEANDPANIEYIRSFIESGYKLTDGESHEKDVDGNDKYFLNSLVGTIEDGFLIRVWGTQRDITEQKLAEQSLIDSEERYRALVEATSTVVWRATPEGELNFVGSSWETITGQRIDEILGSGWLQALHAEDREETVKAWQHSLAAKSIYETEFRVLTITGEYRWFAVRAVPIFDAEGNIKEWIGANTDIHERKSAEEAVRESEVRFRNMADHAPVMVWVTDASGYCNYLSQSWYEFTGQKPREGFGYGWLKAVHPNDLEIAEKTFIKANEKQEPFRCEYRLRRADGSYAWAIDSAQPRISQNGEYLGFIGSVIDISERKMAEEKVRQSEANFRQLAEAVPQFVWITEADGTISYINQQWLDFSGLSLDDINNPQKMREVYHPEDVKLVETHWKKAFTDGEVLEIELRMRNLQNHYQWFLTRSRPIKDTNGEILKWFGTSTDITEGKQAENRLAILAEISEAIRKLDDADELLFAVSRIIGEHLQVKRCLFNEIDFEDDLETVHRDYCRGVESVAGKHRISNYSSITTAEMVAGNTVVNFDSQVDPRTSSDYEKTYESNGERSYVAVPLLRENRWVASLWVSDDKPRQWSRQEISMLETVAERTWTAIEKLRINNALRQSEEHLQLAVEISRISTFEIDLETDDVQTDAVGREIYGFTADEPLTFAKIKSRFHPEDSSEVERRVAEAFEPEGSREFEVEQRIIRTDGAVRWIRVRGRGFFKDEGTVSRAVRCLGTYVDITESKTAEEALRISEERYRSLFETIDEGFCLCEMIFNDNGKPIDYRFLEINPAFERMTRLENAAGRTVRELMPNLESHWFEIYGNVVLTGEAIRFVEGSEAMNSWFDVYASRVGDADSRKFALLFTNITERKQAEAERERLLVSEQKAREVAEEANHAKDEFIALVSHELRSPLNAMLGWTQILQNQNPDEKTKEYALDVIIRNARSQSRLIEDLLDIARVSKGKLRLEIQPTELIPIINAAIEIIKPAAETSQINFNQSFDRAADFINGDVDRLRQVIENLLSNAVKFTPPDGNVEIHLERVDNDAKIIVSDTGQGISAEFLPQIFERFKQADPSTTRRYGGLGIGLSLARDLVELHGGSILAESAGEGHGSTFTVTLPLRVVAPIKDNSDKVENMNSQGKLSGFWILAVDDEADARELVSFMLQINGAKVTSANSAVEALDILKNTNGRLPDVLLSDISMPNESGYALLEKIRSLPVENGGQLPAIALTAFSRPEDRQAAFDAGFQKHLGKPVEPDDLINAIIETAGKKEVEDSIFKI